MELDLTPVLHLLVWDDQPEDLREYLVGHPGVSEIIDRPFRGVTALGLACQLGRTACARVLLEEGGASCFVPSALGFVPAQDANAYGDRELVKLLFGARQRQLAKQWKVREAAVHHALCLVFQYKSFKYI